MEVVGTAIAVASIAGLFSTALDVIGYVRSAAALGRTQEVLQVKIEVEKVRLLIWGQSIGLDGPPDAVNTLLAREDLRTAVAALLASFVKIFDNSDRLRERYGLVQREPDDASAGPRPAEPQLLGSMFKRVYDQFKGDPLSRQTAASLGLKMHWAIGDEMRFRRLVDELKVINDSLGNLVPKVQRTNRMRLRTEIMRSADTHQLQNLVTASDGPGDVVSETASLRLEMLSIPPQTTVIRPGPPVAAPTPPPPPPPPPARPLYDDTGALVIHKLLVTPQKPSIFAWQANLDPLVQSGAGGGSGEDPAAALFCVPPRILPYSEDFLRFQPEADPAYPGWAPASVSLHGFAQEHAHKWALEDDRPRKTWRHITMDFKSVDFDYYIWRWREIKLAGGLGPNWTEEDGRKEVDMYILDNHFTWLDRGENVKIRQQIIDLLAILEQRNEFISMVDAPSFSKVGFEKSKKSGIVDSTFLPQMVLAMELLLRLERSEGGWHGRISAEIAQDMVAAHLWMQNHVVLDAMAVTDLRTMAVHHQNPAMMDFADSIEWPLRNIVRECFEQKSYPIDQYTWDWMFGHVLPGSRFPACLMSSLIHITFPQGVPVPTDTSNVGVLTAKASYWRSRCIVGRVLAAVPDMNELHGWVGPCTVTDRGDSQVDVVRIQSRDPTLKFNPAAGGELDPSLAAQIQPADGNFDWCQPDPPGVSKEVCVLKKLFLLSVPVEVDELVSALPQYRAKVEFRLRKARKTIQMTLYCNSIFIAAPPCAGTHKFNSRLAARYAMTTYEVAQLDTVEVEVEGITVINATGRGGEALARAWCSEKGTNAVIWKRGRDCCFKCGLMVAGKDGVGVDVLIAC